VGELAEAEHIDSSYSSRILRLAFLAPDIIEAILDGRQPKGPMLADLLVPMPVAWERRRGRHWAARDSICRAIGRHRFAPCPHGAVFRRGSLTSRPDVSQ